jgi:hypothetical protein
MRRLIGLAAALVGGLALCFTASAAQPVIVPVNNTDTLFQNVCAFDVLAHITSDKEFFRFFSGGQVLITGKLKVTMTNLSTGKTLAYNVSGPARITSDGTFYGEGLGFGIADGTLFQGKGLFRVTPDGQLTQIGGTRVDICAALS